MDVKAAIDNADVSALRSLLSEDCTQANQLISWGIDGELLTHPLHYVSDMLFDGTLRHGSEMPLVEALLEAGADSNYRAPNGETPLIGAASLGAEEVGLRLVRAGARPNVTGGFGETALHWAAHIGLRRLVGSLLGEGADVNLRDTRYHATPLGWAVNGRFRSQTGKQGEHPEVAELLVAAGAVVEGEWRTDARVRSDSRLFAAVFGQSL